MSDTNGEKKEMDVPELKAQLAEALQARDEALQQLRSQLSTPKSSGLPNTTCSFLRKLPVEIRNQVYYLLLVNEVLSTSQALPQWGKDHVHISNYDLSPAILRTCRQINEEGSKILYGSNVFVIYFPGRGSPQTPVIRRWKFISEDSDSNDVVAKDSVFRRVRHWKIVLDVDSTWYSEHGKPQSKHRYFRYFCEVLCHNPPKSLQVLVKPNANRPENSPPTWYTRKPWSPEFCYDEMSEFLDPLSSFRNIHHFQLVELNGVNFPLRYEDCYNGWSSPSGSLIQPRKVPQHLADRMKILVEGDSPVQFLFEISQKLLKYAQSFETNKDFQINMDPDRDFVEKLEQANSDQCSRCRACGPDRTHGHIIRPFIGHPVEHGLYMAHKALSRYNTSEFKVWRNVVVLALEAQFQRLSTAALNIAEIIKREKREGGALEVGRRFCDHFDPEFVTDLAVCLEDYGKAFLRDMPHLTRSQIRLMHPKLDVLYSTTSIQVSVRQASDALDQVSFFDDCGKYIPRKSLEPFFDSYKVAVDELDSQFLKIRQARKALFDSDMDEWECDIDLELGRCDEMIDWTVNEPDTDVPTQNLPAW